MPITSVLICHHDEPLNRVGLARWLASFTDLCAVIVVREPGSRVSKRIKREVKRVGWLRFLDVLAFRFYYKFALAGTDESWTENTLQSLVTRYPELPASCRIIETPSPNSEEVLQVLKETQPQIMIARCKNILKREVFQSPSVGTFVMHPGICPEYRNAHGCFWALANRDMKKVGMTLLRVDPGVDTGPTYGYYHCDFDEVRESHIVIQARVVFDNLDSIRDKLNEIVSGNAKAIDVSGRPSKAWGQPWLTSYLKWKRAAKQA